MTTDEYTKQKIQGLYIYPFIYVFLQVTDTCMHACAERSGMSHIAHTHMLHILYHSWMSHKHTVRRKSLKIYVIYRRQLRRRSAVHFKIPSPDSREHFCSLTNVVNS